MRRRFWIALTIAGLAVGAALSWKKHVSSTAPKTFVESSHPFDEPPPLGDSIPLAGCVTIDQDSDNNGLLACAQRAASSAQTAAAATWWTNAPHSPQETNLDRAFINLGTNCTKSTAMLIGHGESGKLHVGGGSYASADRSKFIADISGYGGSPQPWNIDDWIRAIDANHIANKFTTITLLGCATGAPPSGEQLLKEFSARTSSLVKAPTARVWCDENHRLWLEKGAGWTVAQNGNVLQTGPTPSLHPTGLQENVETAQFSLGEKNHYAPFALDSFRTIRLCVFSTPSHPIDLEKQCKIVSNDKEALLQSVFWADPFQPHAVPNSEVTGTIDLFPSDPTDKCIRSRGCFHFEILNDDLIADFDTKTYYYVNSFFNHNWHAFD